MARAPQEQFVKLSHPAIAGGTLETFISTWKPMRASRSSPVAATQVAGMASPLWKIVTALVQWMCVPSLLTQGLARKRQFDGRFTQKQDAASNSNMEAALAMKITLTQKKNAINGAHLKVKTARSVFT